MAEYMAYIGTYSKGENGGIFRAMIDSETGDLRVLDTTDVENPSHLALAPDGKHLYAASETGEFRGRNGGAAAACAVDAEGKLTLKQIVKVGGKTPREFAYTPDGKMVFCCNQDSSDITVLKVNADGTLTLTDKRFELPRPVSLIWKN